MTACGKTTVPVKAQAECEVPLMAELPLLSRQELAPLDDNVYWKLQRRETIIADWAFEMQAMLEVLCDGRYETMPGTALGDESPTQ